VFARFAIVMPYIHACTRSRLTPILNLVRPSPSFLLSSVHPHHCRCLSLFSFVRPRFVPSVQCKCTHAYIHTPTYTCIHICTLTELEAFLIANREEYLRHSALNYTVQQKQYNNRLTELLLDLAAEHGYVFDEADFSFVTVRDRIRCYFKSYVQSAKKRGIIIGYAARKAGLLSEEDLERSAQEEGHIVMPADAEASVSACAVNQA